MESRSEDGASRDVREEEMERLIHFTGGSREISKLENGACRWRKMVAIGKRR